MITRWLRCARDWLRQHTSGRPRRPRINLGAQVEHPVWGTGLVQAYDAVYAVDRPIYFYVVKFAAARITVRFTAYMAERLWRSQGA